MALWKAKKSVISFAKLNKIQHIFIRLIWHWFYNNDCRLLNVAILTLSLGNGSGLCLLIILLILQCSYFKTSEANIRNKSGIVVRNHQLRLMVCKNKSGFRVACQISNELWLEKGLGWNKWMWIWNFGSGCWIFLVYHVRENRAEGKAWGKLEVFLTNSLFFLSAPLLLSPHHTDSHLHPPTADWWKLK